MNTQSLCLAETASRTPDLIALKERLSNAVMNFENISLEIKSKLQRIKMYHEPEPCNNPQPIKAKQPDSFAEEMWLLLNLLETYGARLQFSIRHLNEII